MSDELWQHFRKLFNDAEFPTSDVITDEGYDIFERGLDILLMYRGHPNTLMQAFHVFRATGIRPYALAGAAAILQCAAYISGSAYAGAGIQEAMHWLNRAQRYAIGRFEIDVLEVAMLDSLQQIVRMRDCLDRLRGYTGAGESYRYAIAEMNYWEKKRDMRQVVSWNERAFKAASNDIQRLFALNSLAGTYLSARMDAEALGLYHEVVKINPQDPWAWHNMSLIYMDKKNYAMAGDCNCRALAVMDFGNAQDVREKLVAIWTRNRLPDSLDDVPPYVIQTGESGQKDDSSFLKRWFG